MEQGVGQPCAIPRAEGILAWWGHGTGDRRAPAADLSWGTSFEAVKQGLEEKIVQDRAKLMHVGTHEKDTFAKGVFKMFKEAEEKVGGNPTMAQQSFNPKWMPTSQQEDLSAGVRDL